MKRGMFKMMAAAVLLLLVQREAWATSCYVFGGCEGPSTFDGGDEMWCDMDGGTWYPDSDDCTNGVALNSTSPANGDRHVALSENLTLTFGENIVAGTGTIELKNDADDSVVESFDITNASDATINTTTLTLLKSTTLDKNTTCYLTIPATAIVSEANGTKTFPGYSDNTGLKFSTNYYLSFPDLSDVTLAENASAHTVNLFPLSDPDEAGITFSISPTDTTYASLALTQFAQLGSDIDGETANDYSGTLALSSDGTIMAIGAVGNDGTDAEAGHVRVYEYSGGSWNQLGADIDGEAASDRSGTSVSLSSDGTIVAVGADRNDGTADSAGHVRVYQYSSGSWSQLGADIDGEANGDKSGTSVALSSDGTILAVGAPYNDGTSSNAGHVRVYEYSGGSWSQLGADIDGEAGSDFSGHSVDISSDGTKVAIGAFGNDSYAGHVRVYEYSGGNWNQLGADIDGEAASDKSGTSVALSSDGTIMAIGAPNNDGTGSSAGHVRVYEYSGGSWNQLGADIDGEATDDYSGTSVSLSSDGTTLAIGAPYNDGTGSSAGHVRVYQYSSGSWTKIIYDIDGEAAGDYSGNPVALSSDGTIMAIGATRNGGTGSSAGHVRAYSIRPTLTITPKADQSGTGTITLTATDGHDPIEKSFTLTVGDPTAPTLTASPASTSTGSSVATFTATADEEATGYWVVLPSGATVPSTTQVAAGNDSNDQAVALSGNSAMSANTSTTFSITGLTGETSYTIYFVAKDSAGNLGTLQTLVITTTDFDYSFTWSTTANKWNMVSVPDLNKTTEGEIASTIASSYKFDSTNGYVALESSSTTEIDAQTGLWIYPTGTSVVVGSNSENTIDLATMKANWKALSANTWHLLGVVQDLTFPSPVDGDILRAGCNTFSFWHYSASQDMWNVSATIPAASAVWIKHNCSN